MDLTRRRFMQVTAGVTAGLAVGNLGFNFEEANAYSKNLKTKFAKETTTICCYCAVGCGLIVHTDKKSERSINIEGDPDHVINKGSLCPKGASIRQLAENENRLLKPMYRAPYSDKWKEVSWEWALEKIAERVKESRDKSFETKNKKGQIVNRTTKIASVGSAAMDNEECWTYQALLRSLGLVYIEHQARI